MLLTVASEYKISACVSNEKILARSASVFAENSEERLHIVPVERLTTPFVSQIKDKKIQEVLLTQIRALIDV